MKKALFTLAGITILFVSIAPYAQEPGGTPDYEAYTAAVSDQEYPGVFPVEQNAPVIRKMHRSHDWDKNVSREMDDPNYSDRNAETEGFITAAPLVTEVAVVGENSVKITIPNITDAESSADYIYLCFNPDKKIKLYGTPISGGYEFRKNTTYTWDLSASVLETVNQDDWDNLCLQTVSTDGIRIGQIWIKHSSEEVLDWNSDQWLDSPTATFLGLSVEILAEKRGDLSNPTNQAVHCGVLELGKTDRLKYGSGTLWCSEFASWCLRKCGWDTPTGSIGTSDLMQFFSDLGRLYTKSAVKNKTYIPKAGDYVCVNDSGHSVIFSHWVGGSVPATITDTTEYRTIEGNSGNAVRTQTREVGDITRVGSAQ
ncbi:MAG: CHAP domain-containing protein [Chitinivibrionales bacterium]|nr:CHAP domain-containing protein [Chitinivibrionales bacterium]